MRRFVGAVFLVLVLIALAAPAFAQSRIPEGARDPFEPLIAPGTGQATGDGTTDDGGGPVVQPAPDTTDRLATTGMDVQPWLMAAYSLIALGGGAVVWSRVKTLRPH